SSQPSLSKRLKNGRMPRRTNNYEQEWISCCSIKRAPQRSVFLRKGRYRGYHAHGDLGPRIGGPCNLSTARNLLRCYALEGPDHLVSIPDGADSHRTQFWVGVRPLEGEIT